MSVQQVNTSAHTDPRSQNSQDAGDYEHYDSIFIRIKKLNDILFKDVSKYRSVFKRTTKER
jgi:hypothetical protein